MIRNISRAGMLTEHKVELRHWLVKEVLDNPFEPEWIPVANIMCAMCGIIIIDGTAINSIEKVAVFI